MPVSTAGLQSGAALEVGSLIRAMWTQAAGEGAVLARLRRGQEMAGRKGWVKRLAYNRYLVQSRETAYEVRIAGRGVSCECPDHQNRKTVCMHIAAALQRCSDSARDRTDASHAGTKPAEESAAAKDVDDITKEEAVALLTAKFPQVDMQEMLDMPPKDAMVRMAEAFDGLAPQEASVDVQAHIQALMLCMMRDIISEDPEFITRLEPAGEHPPACPKCGAEYVKNGVRKNEKGPEQTYRCKGPGRHRFVFNPGFERRRYPNTMITRAVRLYCEIGSIRVVAGELASEGDDGPHYSTVARWIHDMVSKTVEYLRGLGMRGIGHVCSTDEVIEDVLGRGSCISTLLDHDTRFCLAVRVSRTKDGQNSADLFRAAREMTGRNPLITLSDSLEAIGNGHDEVFGANPCSILVREAHIRNQRHTNNRHERFNSTLRGMFHGRRGRLSHIVIEAAWLYYNYIRPHMALDNVAPAKKAGMLIMGPNKLMTLFQNAAMSRFAIPHPQWTKNLEQACWVA